MPEAMHAGRPGRWAFWSAFSYLAVAATVFALATLGLFRSMVLFPWIFGSAWALFGVLNLVLRKQRTRPKSRTVLLLFGFVLSMGSPLGQALYERSYEYRIRRAVLVEFGRVQAPALLYAHVVNGPEDDWTLESFKGKLTLLNFWATWSSPCVKELEELDEFSRTMPASSVQVIGFTRLYREDSSAEASASELGHIRKMLHRLEIGFPTLVAANDATHKAYRVDILPTTVLLGEHGQVLDYGIGIGGTRRVFKSVDKHLNRMQ